MESPCESFFIQCTISKDNPSHKLFSSGFQSFYKAKKKHNQVKKNFICHGSLRKDVRIWLVFQTIHLKDPLGIQKTVHLMF